MDWITKYWVEWGFGLLIALLGLVWTHLTRKLKQAKAEQDAIKAGMLALLRAQLVNDYQKYSERGSAPVYARENFENVYKQYKALGGNGVMEDLHGKFFDIPVE